MQIRSISDWQCEIGENCLKTKSLDRPRRKIPDFFFLKLGGCSFLKKLMGGFKCPRMGCHVYINAPLSKITPAMLPKNVWHSVKCNNINKLLALPLFHCACPGKVIGSWH